MDWREVYEPNTGGGRLDDVTQLRQRIQDLENQHEADQREIEVLQQARQAAYGDAARFKEDYQELYDSWLDQMHTTGRLHRDIAELNENRALLKDLIVRLKQANEELRNHLTKYQEGAEIHPWSAAHHDSSGRKMML